MPQDSAPNQHPRSVSLAAGGWLIEAGHAEATRARYGTATVPPRSGAPPAAIPAPSPSNGDLGLSAHLARVLGPTRYKPTQYHPTIPCGEALPIPGNVALDLEKQSCIPDGSFDLVITQDVFEHIYDAAAAFAEIERTLKPGGMHIFTVPVTSKMNATFEAATRASDGSVIMHAPPEVHGNPMSGDGSLLTHQWGFDIVDFVRRHARGTSARQMPLGLSPLPGSLKGFAHKATIVPI